MHCGKVTTFEKVDTNRYYPMYLYSNGYCMECHELGCNVQIRNLRMNKEKCEE